MSEGPDNPRFYVFLILGLAVVAAVLAFVVTGGRLPGTTNSPTAEVSGRAAQ
jgi:ABC-type transporter Mla subunit MlaD